MSQKKKSFIIGPKCALANKKILKCIIETFNQLSCNISSVHISFVFISLVNKAAPLHEYLSKNEVDEYCQNLAGCLSIFLCGDQL